VSLGFLPEEVEKSSLFSTMESLLLNVRSLSLLVRKRSASGDVDDAGDAVVIVCRLPTVEGAPKP